MRYEPGLPNSGKTGSRTGFTQEDAQRRFKTFPSAFKNIIIIIAVAVLYFAINAALNSQMMLSSRYYENVELILVDNSSTFNENYTENEFFDMLKNTWTKKPSESLLVSQAEEFIQHTITVEYLDGTQDIIYLYYNPYSERNNGYVLRNMTGEDEDKLVLSYSGYDKLMEYIGDILG